MKIEAGKDYQTRGGLSAKVFMINGGASCEAILGAILDRRGCWLSAIWNPDGSLCSLSPSAPSEQGAFDLVPRKRTVYVNLYKEFDGTRFWMEFNSSCEAIQNTATRELSEDRVTVICRAIPIEIEE